MKTINQLLDQISDIPLDSMTEELGYIRQKLIDLKKSSPERGLTKVKNTEQIQDIIDLAVPAIKAY